MKILMFLDTLPWSPNHFLHKALEETPGVNVFPVYVDRSSRAFWLARRFHPFARFWTNNQWKGAVRAYEKQLPFDLVLVSEWLDLPFEVRGLAEMTAYYGYDSPRARPRYERINHDSYDLFLNGQPCEASWLKEVFSSARIETFPLAAPRHLYEGEKPAADTHPTFLGTWKTGRRASFIKALSGLLPGFKSVPPGEFLAQRDYAEQLAASPVTFHLSENGEVSTRIFEALCAGTPLVCDEVVDLPVILGDDIDLLTTFKFTTPYDSAIMASRGMLKALDLKNRVMVQRKSMLAKHTYHARAASLVQIVEGM